MYLFLYVRFQINLINIDYFWVSKNLNIPRIFEIVLKIPAGEVRGEVPPMGFGSDPGSSLRSSRSPETYQSGSHVICCFFACEDSLFVVEDSPDIFARPDTWSMSGGGRWSQKEFPESENICQGSLFLSRNYLAWVVHPNVQMQLFFPQYDTIGDAELMLEIIFKIRFNLKLETNVKTCHMENV